MATMAIQAMATPPTRMDGLSILEATHRFSSTTIPGWTITMAEGSTRRLAVAIRAALAGADTWEGTTRASCGVMTIRSRCNAEQNVSITFVQGENSKIGGFYKCSYGNLNCYNMDTTGKVANATVNGTQISMLVIMPDATSCRFSGRNDSGNVIGDYSCYRGGGSFEQGTWRARRSY